MTDRIAACRWSRERSAEAEAKATAPAGTRVRIAAVHGMSLRVEPAG